MKIEGRITYVAEKTKGIKLDNKEVWYNPVKEIYDKVTKELMGKTVMLDVIETSGRLLIKDIEICDDLSPPDVISKDEYWKRKEERDIRIEKARAKGASLNTAIEIYKVAAGLSLLNEYEGIDDLYDAIIKKAEGVMRWTTTEDGSIMLKESEKKKVL